MVRAVIPVTRRLQHAGRYPVTRAPNVAEGWTLTRLTAPSRLFGANGLRTGPDGRVYIAQVTGSQISALDLSTGRLDTVCPKGGAIIAPDDLAFDQDGNLYATEVMDGRVSVRAPDGHTRVLRDDIPSANGITFHQGRLFVGECRDGGRLLELDLNGGAPRVLARNLPSPNAMEVGPDGLLYFPVMGANEIWRIDPDGGVPQCVAGDLGVPDAVKFDPHGHLVSTQVHSGEVLRINPRTGDRTVLAALHQGLDNLTFVGERLFVSSFTGEITEILGTGETRTTLPGGLTWPLGLAVDADGDLYIADGTYFYVLLADGTLRVGGMLFSAGYPGFLRGVAALGSGEFAVTTSNGEVARYRPWASESEVLATGLDQLYGVAVAGSGALFVAERGAGRVLSVRPDGVEVMASGLSDPVGVAVTADGRCVVTEADAGRVRTLGDTGTLLDGLQCPQGVAICDRQVYVIDSGAKQLVAVDLGSRTRHTIAWDLPVGAPAGVTPKPLRGMPPFSGPQGPFAAITPGPDATLYISADADGSVLALRRES
ncbi:gluconolaconase [Mycobacterium liflandii]|nr:gluconolaconase [Mycobacterium liflandii]